MTPDEYRQLDGCAIDELVATGQVAVAEVHQAATQVHEQTHDQINAVLDWYHEPGLGTGATPLAPRPVAGLQGVPFLRKDYGSAEAGGLVEMGSRLALGNRAAVTDPFIADLLAAGVQLVGRSAVPEFIQHGVTESRVHGATRNPWDLALSAGGSSGGAGAAVAAGVVPIAHASDCAGSIRIPASTCGLVGLKPGRQRVPWATDWDGIAQEFVVCRTVRDARRCLDIAGRGDYQPVPSRPVSVALSLDHWAGMTAQPDVVQRTQAIASLLAQAGHAVGEIAAPVNYQELMDTWPSSFARFALQDAERMARVTGRPIDESTLEPMTLAAIAGVRSLSAEQHQDSALVRRRVVNDLEQSLTNYDVLLTPTLGRSQIPLNTLGGETDPNEYSALNDAIFPYSYVFNLSGWPAISVPAGADEHGHPIGVQLSAPIGSEHVLLALAAKIEQAQPWPLTAPLPA